MVAQDDGTSNPEEVPSAPHFAAVGNATGPPGGDIEEMAARHNGVEQGGVGDAGTYQASQLVMAPGDVFMQPYIEVPVLAAVVTAEELAGIYPTSRAWPADVAENVRALHGQADLLPERPYAGRARVTPVDEPGALQVLGPVSQVVALDHYMPSSFSWVEIADLIATQVIAEPLPDVQLSNDDIPALARYSLYNAPIIHELPGGGLLATESLQVAFLGQTSEMYNVGTDPQRAVAVHYTLQRIIHPVVVGYEEGKFYLLTGYGRVLQALRLGVERLLCLVYYGLDLQAPDFGVRVPGLVGRPINHIGPRRLLRGPLVRDFLDPALSVMAPTRARLWTARFIVVTGDTSLDFRPQIDLPLQ